ncbi:Por secretion system C-terminal sorting domain-containing protein [Lishizhenia tianjinensis]|uniref:Por secretion system C-terminal sorting domain-containing protein n=1 Tax=Lishizhenia tianjinensis TaxID=477690 RepID=A0A1I7AWH5_9FLAO|nr:GEVED domain-containing protein [Lishizhenia tianjinensis]SFT79282.1 Por secretion system C-terminal sorting domain-containing protein [Lishizhenia tianjinensis]
MKRKLLTLAALAASSWSFGQYCSGGPSSIYDSNVGSVNLQGQSSNIAYTGCPGVTGLEDQTNMVADLNAGTQYTVTVDWSTCGGTYGNAGSVWIDFNGNFTFEASELIGDWSGSPSNTSTYNFTVPLSSVNGIQRMRVMQREGGSLPLDPCGSYTWGSLTDFGIAISGGTGCGSPYNLTVVNGTTSSVELSWDYFGVANGGYIVEYGPVGFTPGSGTSSSVTTVEEINITGMPADELYEVYVRAICGAGDTSLYFGPVQVNTYGQGHYLESNLECGPGFMDIQNSGTQYALGLNGSQDITLPFPVLHHGIEYTNATIYQDGMLALGANTNLLTYNTNLLTQTGSVIGFYPYWEDMEAAVDPDDGIFTQVIGTAPNRTFIVQWDLEHDFANGQNLTYQLQLNEATMDAYYLYDQVETPTSTYYNYGYAATLGIVTDFEKQQVSYLSSSFLENNSCLHYYYTNCPKIENLQVTTYDYDQIGITWSPGLANESSWTIEYGPAGFTPGTGTTISTTNTYDTITGLTQLTDYDVYVYSECGVGNTGAGIKVAHQTAPLCANPFGIGATGAPDSIYASWNWQPNGSGQLPVSYNIAYVPSGQDVYGPNSTEYNTGGSVYADSIFDPNLIASGVYDVYVQTICNTGDTSLYVGPVNFLAFLDNDSSCFAQELQVDGNPYILYNNGAQLDAGIQTIAPPASGFYETDGWGNQNMYRTTWYTFTAPASGDVMISGTDVNFSGKMAVYESANCADYNQFNLIGANDNGVLFSSTAAPEWVVCGLTPNQTYYLLHSSNSNSQGNFSIRLTELDFNAGTTTGVIDACIGDTVDLFNSITNYDVQYGRWIDLANTSQMVSQNDFATTVLASQVYDFEYRVELGCSYDSIIGQVKIFPNSSAGEDGSVTVCKNEPINLFYGLTGNVDLGGTWYDPQDQPVSGNIPSAGTVPGQFNYDYVAGNGVCPDDTALVVVIVNPSCDWLSVENVEIEGVTVYPNPTSDVLNIVSAGEHDDLAISVIDVNGRIVRSSSEKLVAGGSVQLNVADLNTGVYLVELHNGAIKNTYRIVVQ